MKKNKTIAQKKQKPIEEVLPNDIEIGDIDEVMGDKMVEEMTKMSVKKVLTNV